MDEINVKIDLISPNDGDIVIITVPGNLPDSNLNFILKYYSNAFPNNKVLLKTDEVSIILGQ